MTRSLIARFVTLLVIAAAVVSAVPAFAQEALALPAAPTAAGTASDPSVSDPAFVLLAAQPVYPQNNATFFPGLMLTWTDASAPAYAAKFKVVETGASFTLKLQNFNCAGANCSVSSLGIGLYDRVRDGQHVQWQIITKIGATKLKSATFPAVIDELDVRGLIAPAAGSSVTMGALTGLSWQQGGSVNLGYQVLVKNNATGKTVINRLIAANGGNCSNDTCTLPITQNEKIMSLQASTTYSWWVVYIGRTGEQGKSAKQTFTIQ